MKRYFYKETGMYIDWSQLEKLPEIDTLIDIGVGPQGTPDLYKKFKKKKLILIDPLDEAEKFFNNHMQGFDAMFFKTALGEKKGSVTINVETHIGRSSILDVADINFEGEPFEKRIIPIDTLDNILVGKDLGKVGVKIDTEGYELNVIRGASKILEQSKFVIAEVRHNHESFKEVYKLNDFVLEMQVNGFILTMILTAKPFIADLCFQPLKDLHLPY
jgi:FkbM family methyltransferase